MPAIIRSRNICSVIIVTKARVCCLLMIGDLDEVYKKLQIACREFRFFGYKSSEHTW